MLHISKLEVKGIVAQNLTLRPGEIISLSGASGMGKSLFMKGVADLVMNRGHISVNGVGRFDLPAPQWRRQITYVSAQPAWWYDKVEEHFADPAWLEEVVEYVDLSPKLIRANVSRLSSGEAQRFALLRALEASVDGDVRYLLLDEPTSALDGGRQSMVEELLNRFVTAEQMGILFISHDERQVERFAHKHWQIYDRRVQEVAS
ncbi:ATP-binding cassette domain-containing protein [Terasakiella sp. SH-1]|uniref:ABC transporter ATP-binding protein n=1 Tax=Terasakiella sp. SH-1 TaxID=2560057 RepID=UPI001073F3D3|nr:ATP-binding cassette domain-containing protein [Terasakiella sp. SH-1]